MSDKIVPCLWYDRGQALKAVRFYMSLGLPDSRIDQINGSPADNPYSGHKQGEELTVAFTLAGRPFLALAGGPGFPHTEAVSFTILTDDQAETDRLWDAIVSNGGAESACGWCKDRWGVNWQVTPRRLIELTTHRDPATAKAAFESMMTMTKIDIAALDRAVA